MIEIDNVYKSFGDLEVVKGVSLTVNKGEVVSIIGGSHVEIVRAQVARGAAAVDEAGQPLLLAGHGAEHPRFLRLARSG